MQWTRQKVMMRFLILLLVPLATACTPDCGSVFWGGGELTVTFMGADDAGLTGTVAIPGVDRSTLREIAQNDGAISWPAEGAWVNTGYDHHRPTGTTHFGATDQFPQELVQEFAPCGVPSGSMAVILNTSSFGDLFFLGPTLGDDQGPTVVATESLARDGDEFDGSATFGIDRLAGCAAPAGATVTVAWRVQRSVRFDDGEACPPLTPLW